MICMQSIVDFASLTCMSCVCSGTFHEKCLLALKPLDASLGQDVTSPRSCPCCRRKGVVTNLLECFEKMYPVSGLRGNLEKRLLQMTPDPVREGLLKAEKHLREQKKILNFLVGQVKTLDEVSCRTLMFRSPASCLSAGCAMCGEAFEELSDLWSQACACQALFHRTCLEASGRQGVIRCCCRCGSLDVLARGASVQTAARVASSGAAGVLAEDEDALRKDQQEERLLMARQIKSCSELLTRLQEGTRRDDSLPKRRRLAVG